MSKKLLSIYLNDHLAGATGGLELARRARGANEGTPWARCSPGWSARSTRTATR